MKMKMNLVVEDRYWGTSVGGFMVRSYMHPLSGHVYIVHMYAWRERNIGIYICGVRVFMCVYLGKGEMSIHRLSHIS